MNLRPRRLCLLRVARPTAQTPAPTSNPSSSNPQFPISRPAPLTCAGADAFSAWPPPLTSPTQSAAAAHGPYTVSRRPSCAKLGRAAAGAAVRAMAAARAVLGRAEGRSCAWSRQRKTPAIGKPQPLSTPAARRLGQHVGGRHSGDQQAAARQLQTSQVVSLNCILANIGFICPFACVPWCN